MALPRVRTIADLRRQVRAWRADGDSIALVPTMGALHDGHLSLVGLGRGRARRVVASVFVNPTQFGPNEDFVRYPRDESADAALLAGAGCDLLFAPGVEAIYPSGFSTTITIAGVSEPLDGAARPGHFSGVATVVAKLLIAAEPDIAIFGEKDYQQLQVIRRLVADLALPVEVIAGPTARDERGLALSSRNAYLGQAERGVAPVLFQVLNAAADQLRAGAGTADVEAGALASLRAAGFGPIDYFEARHADDLGRLDAGPLGGQPARLLAAAWLGKTRLIDNLAV